MPGTASYLEFPPPAELADIVACTWSRTTALGASATTLVLPDGCVDIVHGLAAGLFVAGPDTGPAQSRAVGGTTFVGVRFRPGAAGTALGLPAEELRDLRVGLDEIWGTESQLLAARLEEASDAAAARRVLAAAITARRPRMAPADRLVLAAVQRVRRENVRVPALADELAIGERQLRRRFRVAVGYGPKTLQRVVRMRRVLAAAEAGAAAAGLARLAREVGYADQAHMTRECVRLTGRTPSALLARGSEE